MEVEHHLQYYQIFGFTVDVIAVCKPSLRGEEQGIEE